MTVAGTRLAQETARSGAWRRWAPVAMSWLAAHAALAAGPEVQDKLLAAIAARDLNTVRTLVANGADLNAPGPFQRTPLHEAAKGIDTPLLEWMLAQGADPQARDGDGRTPLHLANDVSAAVLLRHRADPRLVDQQGNTALHIAAEHSRAKCRLLVQAGVPVNARNQAGLVPLHFAVLAGKQYIVEHLLELGAEVNAKSAADYSFKPSSVGWDVKGMESSVPAGATPLSLARQLHRKNRWVSGSLYANIAEYLVSKGAVERSRWQLAD